MKKITQIQHIKLAKWLPMTLISYKLRMRYREQLSYIVKFLE